MLSDEKILITGPSGMVGRAFASGLVGDNEIWGVARFGHPANRAFLDDLGVRPGRSTWPMAISPTCPTTSPT